MPVTDHTNSVSVQVLLLSNIIDHKGAWFTNEVRFDTCAALNRSNHASVACPFLRIGEVSYSIQVGGNEFAVFILVDAELGVLNLVVIYVSVKTNNNSTDVFIMVELSTGDHVGLLALVFRPSDVWNTDEVKLVTDSNLPNDVDLLTLFSLQKLALFKICSSGKRRREYFFSCNVEPQRIELFLISGTALRAVIRNKETLLSSLPQLVQSFRDIIDQRIAP